MKKFTAIIPTMYKAIVPLNCLLIALVNSESVDEILIIDNSDGINTLKNELRNVPKVRIISEVGNLYVNPSWNLGVKESRNKNILILNDDIIVPNNIFDLLISIDLKNTGLIGMNYSCIKNNENDLPPSNVIKFSLQHSTYRDFGFGIFMMIHKDNYIEIPDEMKIWCGDELEFYHNIKHGRKNYELEFPIFTKMSTTSDLSIFDAIKENDRKIYSSM